MRFTKGHGTGNDFILVDESVELSPDLVAALCDRRFGIGGDGVLRVARQGDLFFMDYWNSDGSLAEMCGNGVRVFARYLWEEGLITGSSVAVATRAGVRTAYLEWDGIRVDMGAPKLLGNSDGGLAVSMGNPHLVYEVSNVDRIDLSTAPAFDEAFFPDGVNVSYYEWVGDDHVRMRVYERGSGETLSCGTGASAVGVAALTAKGQQVGAITVDVPGGRLRVTVDEQTSWLSGPAVLVANGHLDVASLSGRPANPAEHPWPATRPRAQR